MRTAAARLKNPRSVIATLVSEQRRNARLRHEIVGIALLTAGVFLLVSARSPSGHLIAIVGAMMRYLVGMVGAVGLALALAAAGAANIAQKQEAPAARIKVGLGCALFACLGLSQLPSAGSGVIGRTFTEEPGGLLGVVTMEALQRIVGPILVPVALAVLAIAAVALVTDTPPSALALATGKMVAGAARLSWRLAGLRRKPEAQVTPAAGRARPSAVPSAVLKTIRAAAPPRLPAAAEQAVPAPEQPGAASQAALEAAAVSAAAARAAPVRPQAKQLALDEGRAGPSQAQASGERALPPLETLSATNQRGGTEDVGDNVETLEETLRSFGIDAKVVEIERGPRVTRYEVQLPPGVRVARITNLADDLALALAALDVRVEAPVPGKGVIGIEVPNKDVVYVDLKEILASDIMRLNQSKLAFALGKDIAGHPRIADLGKMPHLLIAGATNSGKSVCLNSMIVSILCRAYPDEVKFLMVDPKRVELSLFAGIPHLVAPVAHDAREAAGLLRWAMREMEMRYQLFADAGVRNIAAYNEQVALEKSAAPLYYLVIVIDELADLMMQAAAEFESSICRLAQLARATGIHIVVATQRPSVNVITGTIKANIASRIAFAVASQADSRVVLDINGAERLVGSGDMLFLPFDASKPTRIQGAYVSERDILNMVDWLKQRAQPEYCAEILAVDKKGATAEDEQIDDDLFHKALEFVLSTNYASASMLQRRLRIGYNRAARLIDIMEERGYVGPSEGNRPREVYAGPRTAQ
jgi:S-DNA-T family DNA segregation ATPase FtsK/SpoIIIE